MICAACGEEIMPGAQFCDCGAPVPGAIDEAPSRVVLGRSDGEVCAKCGASLAGNRGFCRSCKAPVPRSRVSASHSAEAPVTPPARRAETDPFAPDPVLPASSGGFVGAMLRKVGIGLGQMELSIDGPHFHYGETVHGRLIYSLAAPTRGERLLVGIEALQANYSADVEKKPRSVYRFELPLGHSGEYSNGDMTFLLRVPAEAEVRLEGDAPVHWSVYGKLELDARATLRKAVDISVS